MVRNMLGSKRRSRNDVPTVDGLDAQVLSVVWDEEEAVTVERREHAWHERGRSWPRP